MTTTTAPGCPVDESFDPLSPEFLADPFAVMAKAEAPVFFAPSIGYYVVTSYDAVEQVFRDPATYSAAVAQAPLAPIVPEAGQILLAGGHKPQPSMVSLDEPEHARLRSPRWSPKPSRSSSRAATGPSPPCPAWTSPRTPGCASRPPARSA